MKKIFFKNDAEFNKYIEKADDLGHRKTFHKKNAIIKIFNVRGLISSGFFNTTGDYPVSHTNTFPVQHIAI